MVRGSKRQVTSKMFGYLYGGKRINEGIVFRSVSEYSLFGFTYLIVRCSAVPCDV